MTTREAYHSDIAAEFLGKARDYLAAGDLLQASEKGWGAAAQTLKAVAEARGWAHRSHRDLYRAVDLAAEESGDPELQDLFHSANALRQNFYEGWMTETGVARGLAKVEQFAGRLERLIGQPRP